MRIEIEMVIMSNCTAAGAELEKSGMSTIVATATKSG
jgi:hypothetical protein